MSLVNNAATFSAVAGDISQFYKRQPVVPAVVLSLFQFVFVISNVILITIVSSKSI